MKEFKGTPGSWVYRKERGEIVSSEHGLMADLICDGFQDENGRLIAAAPDLLEAMQELVFLYEHDDGCRELTEYKRAKAAISKALGED